MIHNLQLDPNRSHLYDFSTEIKSLLVVPRGSRPLEIADDLLFSAASQRTRCGPYVVFSARLVLSLLSLTKREIRNL